MGPCELDLLIDFLDLFIDCKRGLFGQIRLGCSRVLMTCTLIIMGHMLAFSVILLESKKFKIGQSKSTKIRLASHLQVCYFPLLRALQQMGDVVVDVILPSVFCRPVEVQFVLDQCVNAAIGTLGQYLVLLSLSVLET